MSTVFNISGSLRAVGAPDHTFRVGPRQNLLLASLPEEQFEALAGHLEASPLPVGAMICDAGVRCRYGYFPTTAVVSLQQALGQAGSSEVAVIGRDGMVGMSIFIGSGHSTNRSVTHCAGMSYRIRAEILQAEFERDGPFRAIALRYAQIRIAQIGQTAVCNRHHSVEQQVARRLLLSLDQLISSEIPVTHELMATTLGVRREAVTLAMSRLNAEGLIRCTRGRVTVADRKRLAARACECYPVLRRETERLLPPAAVGQSGAAELA